jgi:hypothetical protein
MINDDAIKDLVLQVSNACRYWNGCFTDEYIKQAEQELRDVNACEPEYAIFKGLQDWLNKHQKGIY